MGTAVAGETVADESPAALSVQPVCVGRAGGGGCVHALSKAATDKRWGAWARTGRCYYDLPMRISPRTLLGRSRALLLGASLGMALVSVPLWSEEAMAQARPRRAWLGVELELGPAGGVVARHVVRSSPAARAGVVDGDQLVAIDGAVLETPKQLVARVATAGPGRTVELLVRHGGVEKRVRADLVEHPGRDAVVRLDHLGTFAPAWQKLTSVTAGAPTELAGLRGRVVVLDFWAPWCGPCRLSIPELARLHRAHVAQGLTVLGVTTDEVAAAKQGAEALGIPYPVVSDAEEQTSAAYAVNALPTLFVIDKRGVVREVVVGFEPSRAAAFEELLNKLLAEPAPP